MPLPVGTYSPFVGSLRDHGGEVGTWQMHGLLIDDANFVANQALRDAMVLAINNVTLGVTIYHDYGGLYTIVNPISDAASVSAQRENKILVRYHDVTTLEKLTYTLPTVDLPALTFLTEANDMVQISGAGASAAVVALVTAHEDFVVNPRTNNLTLVDSIEYVGRNS